MTEIRHAIQRSGVQLVLLTATLPTRMENELFVRLAIPRERVTILRSSTIRRNVRYVVRHIRSVNTQVFDMIHNEISINGKVIIYVRFITDGESISKQLRCPFYHSNVGSTDEKMKMLAAYKKTGTLMVATNAMGLGIDIPNIQMVIHVGSPVSLLEYAQESGQAGRDGNDSVALLLHLPSATVDSHQCGFVPLKPPLWLCAFKTTNVALCYQNQQSCFVP
jgi:superfamily II DNA helicase RecQ